MTISIPTNDQIGSAMRQAAYRAAVVLAFAIALAHLTYQAGLATGRFVHWLNDWLADASHHPGESAGKVAMRLVAWSDRILSESAPSAEPLLAEGAVLLSVQDLEKEIAEYEEKQQKPVARRKPARARKVKEAA